MTAPAIADPTVVDRTLPAAEQVEDLDFALQCCVLLLDGVRCAEEATWLATWRTSCECNGNPSVDYFCTRHAEWIKWHGGDMEWRCKKCDSPSRLLRVEPL